MWSVSVSILAGSEMPKRNIWCHQVDHMPAKPLSQSVLNMLPHCGGYIQTSSNGLLVIEKILSPNKPGKNVAKKTGLSEKTNVKAATTDARLMLNLANLVMPGTTSLVFLSHDHGLGDSIGAMPSQ